MALLWAFLACAAVLTAHAAPPAAPTADISALFQRSLHSQLAEAKAEEEGESEMEHFVQEEEEEESEMEHFVQEEDLAEGHSLDEFGHVMSDFVDGLTLANVTDVTNGTNSTNRTNRTLGGPVQPHELGPIAYTKLGPIVGTSIGNCHQFRGIRFAETPKRFEVSEKKKAWAPKIYDARKGRAPCVGAEKSVETEDCLILNIWATQGFKDMPVLVYFHGGMNQHGTGMESTRAGDGITNVTEYPTVFVTLDWRLGVFGWMHFEGSNVSRNLGLLDQQLALRWIQENIRAFGGDPNQVLLQGQSEGCSAIFTHMVAPGSKGLFQKAVWHSPVANVWSRNTNRDRTNFLIKKSRCKRKTAEETLRCLKMMGAQELWSLDWVAEALSRNVGSPLWSANAKRFASFALTHGFGAFAELGWHSDIDNVTLFGDPNELIHLGRFHNVTVLMTTNRNETHGVMPRVMGDLFGQSVTDKMMGSFWLARGPYAKTFKAQGIQFRRQNKEDQLSLMYQMITDKLWMCDMKSLAGDMARAGAKVYFGFQAHQPKFSAVGARTNPECAYSAMCHADEMPYILPQGPRVFRNQHPEEDAFVKAYSEAFLAWVHENSTGHAWVPYDPVTQPITFYQGSAPPFVVPGYRKEQCEVLDRFNGPSLPKHMRMRRAA